MQQGGWHMTRSRRLSADRRGLAAHPLKVLLAAVWLLLPSDASRARDLVVFGEPTLMTALQRVGAVWRSRQRVRRTDRSLPCANSEGGEMRYRFRSCRPRDR